MVFAGVFPFSSYGGIDREERKHRKVLFLFKAQQIEKSESGPSFWRVQIWNDRSQKPKKNYNRHPVVNAARSAQLDCAPTTELTVIYYVGH